jgi:hypothetical protein
MLEFIRVLIDCRSKGAGCERPIHQGKPVITKSGKKCLKKDWKGGFDRLPEQLFVTAIFHMVKAPSDRL